MSCMAQRLYTRYSASIVPAPPSPHVGHPITGLQAPMNASAQRRMRRPRLLIVGCGDVGLRVLRLLRGRWHVTALTSSPERRADLRAAGALPLLGDLDQPATLGRLAHVADAVLHLAPPAVAWRARPAHAGVVARVGARRRAAAGVCQHQRRVRRLRRRVGATKRAPPSRSPIARGAASMPKRSVRAFARALRVHATVLRVPGIYALDRAGGDPRERVRRGTPALVPADDVFTNHIHADDLARACVAALLRGPTLRTIHVNDDSALPLGDHLDRVADASGLPRVPRVTRAQAAAAFQRRTAELSQRVATPRQHAHEARVAGHAALSERR